MTDFLKNAEEWEDGMSSDFNLTIKLEEEVKKLLEKIVSECSNEDSANNKIDEINRLMKDGVKQIYEQKRYDDQEMNIITESIDKLTNKKD